MGIETFRNNVRATDADAAPVTPGSFSVTTEMMQDAVRAHGVSVGEGDYNQEFLFGNPFKDGREEALIINAGGQLTYLERTESSETGWTQGEVSAVPKLAEVVAVVHPSGVVWAICSPADGAAKPFSMYLVEEQETDGTLRCSWKKGAEFNIEAKNARSLYVSYSPDSGPLVLGAALSAGGSCFVLAPQLPPAYPDLEKRDPWVLRSTPLAAPGAPLVGGGFLPYFPSTGQKNVYVFYFLAGSNLTRYEESGGQVRGPYVISQTLEQFCGTYYVPNLDQDNPQGDVGCAFFDTIAYTYLITASCMAPGHHIEFSWTPVNEFDPNAQARLWQDADGRLHLFANSSMDNGGPAGDLRVLHQASWQSDARGHGPDRAQVVTPKWTSARVSGAPKGIGGYDLLLPQDRLVAFDYSGDGQEDHLLAYRPGVRTVWVISRTRAPGGFTRVFESTTGLPGYDFASLEDRVVAYDYKGTKSARHLLAYRPGAGKFAIFTKKPDEAGFHSVVSADAGGIGEPRDRYSLDSTADRLIAFDYTRSGKNDCLLAYRPGTGRAWVLVPTADGTFHPQVKSEQGLGGFTLSDPADVIVPLDFYGKGTNTHLLAYRPGAGMAYILTQDGRGGFTAEVRSENGGLGDYPLTSPDDRLLPFDYTGLGRNNHILAYRPGSRTAWILEPKADAATRYSPVVKSSSGLGGYDFASPADTVTGYDYSGTGSMAYLVAYRPGTGKVSVMGQRGGKVGPVYQSPPGDATAVTVGLHSNITNFQLDPYPDYKPSELIKMSGMTAAEAYCICTQDVTTSQWQTDKVRVPPPDSKAKPFIVSHYVAEATLLSIQGLPMRAHNVSVSAESLVEVQIDEVSYQVGPGRTAEVTTNQMGRLSISIAARGLNPPIVHLNADSLESGTAIDFAAQANSFLAGKSSLPSQKGQFTPSLLEKAQTVPNSAGAGAESEDLADWTALKERGLTPQVVVDHCTNMYAQAADSSPVQVTPAGGNVARPVHGYVIQLWDEDRPAFQVFETREELESYQEYRNNHPAYGGWWEEFTSWSSDVWEGIKSGAQKVAEVIVSDIVEIAVWIGNAVVSLGEMIIKGIEEAVFAVEAVFQMIADAVMRVIDWLKSLFAMNDIWDTKEAIQSCVKDTVLPLSKTMISQFGDRSEKWFEDQRTTCWTYFDEIISRYSDTRVGDFQNKSGDVSTSSGDKVSQGDMNTPQANWMRNKTLSANDLPASFASVLDTADNPVVEHFEAFMNDLAQDQHWKNLVDDIGKLTGALTQFLDPSNAATTSSASVSNFLRVIQQFVDDLITAAKMLVKKFVDFTVLVVEDIRTLITQTFDKDLGVIATLYDWVQELAGVAEGEREKPSILGLTSLIMGFFVTAIYKLINGVDKPPFPHGDFIQIPIPAFDATDDDPPDDPDLNRRLVEFQTSAIPGGIVLGIVVGLTDLLKGPPDWVPKWGESEIADEILNFCEIVGNGWAYALGVPSVSSGKKQWDGWGIAGCVIKSFAFVLDIVSVIASIFFDRTGKKSSLLKNLGYDAKNPDEAKRSLIPGSLLQCGLGAGILVCNIGGTVAAKNELPPALFDMAMAESVLDPLPRMIQVGRNFAQGKAAVVEVWPLIAVVDGLVSGASLILQGAAASDAHLHRPQAVQDTVEFHLSVNETFDRQLFNGGESIFQGGLEYKATPTLPGSVTLANNHISGSFTEPQVNYTVQVVAYDHFAPPMSAKTTLIFNVS
ncbi:hypothetical protein ACIP4Q_36760 [Streptomyces massasporeus]